MAKTEKGLVPSSPFRGIHIAAFIAGAFGFAAFFGLTETFPGLEITYHSPFTSSSPGEVYFWLGSTLLLFPASCLIGFGLSPWLLPKLRRLWARVEGMTPKERAAGLLAALFLVLAVSRLSNSLILRGYPITDDEYATKFGGQVLASGHLMAPKPENYEAFSNLFIFEKDGRITSFDWLGPQLAWAVSELTRTGPLVFSLAAALAAVSLGFLLGVRLSPGYGLVALVFFLFSPMAFTLSATTHAHLLSRALIAATLAFYILAARKRTFLSWGLTGFMAGLSFLCRPVETVFLLGPLALDAALNRREWKGRTSLIGLLAGALGPLAVFGIYNRLITGSIFFAARFTQEGPGEALMTGLFWNRFGANTSYNLLMLCVWFLGPLGILLVISGVGTDRVTRLLGAGVAGLLLAGCFHDNHGLHIVGPIHYSECAVPLAVIAVHGLANIKRRMNARGIGFGTASASLACALVLGLGTFTVWNGLALNRQALIQSYIYGNVENSVRQAGIKKAAVLAPQFGALWMGNPYFRKIGCWVFEWRRARPDLSDSVLFLHDRAGLEEPLRKQFPDRIFFRLRNTKEPPYFELLPLDSAGRAEGLRPRVSG